tara:strand:+ start:177 stop:398 length:222 start_codon:yes stop_codon:yes gene_type:complete
MSSIIAAARTRTTTEVATTVISYYKGVKITCLGLCAANQTRHVVTRFVRDGSFLVVVTGFCVSAASHELYILW